MKKTAQREPMQAELILAIGLVWGHLNACQFKQAHQLAIGCLKVWPDENRLTMMAAFAAVELAMPLDDESRLSLVKAECADWSEMVLSRADGKQAASNAQAH